MEGFEDKYKVFYKAVREINIEKSSYNPGISSFRDMKACSDCQNDCDSKEVLKVAHSCDIVKVELEKFFSQFDGAKLSSLKDKCDIMLYDNIGHHITFCELSCSNSKYIEPFENAKGSQPGKRAKAYKQLKFSIEKLAAVPGIESMMDGYAQKTALFAVRRKDRLNSDSSVISNMETFSVLPRNINDGATSDMGHGFTFEVIAYPSVYHW